jgi:hypothetical protein
MKFARTASLEAKNIVRDGSMNERKRGEDLGVRGEGVSLRGCLFERRKMKKRKHVECGAVCNPFRVGVGVRRISRVRCATLGWGMQPLRGKGKRRSLNKHYRPAALIPRQLGGLRLLRRSLGTRQKIGPDPDFLNTLLETAAVREMDNILRTWA